MISNAAHSSRDRIVLADSRPPAPLSPNLTWTYSPWEMGLMTGSIGIALAMLGLHLNRLSKLLKKRDRQIAQIRATDELTGLANRKELYRIGTQSLETLAVEPLALLHLNIDRFRLINDALGNDVGDRILRQVGNRMRAEVDECEAIARISGDTFSLLLRGDDRQAISVAERLLTVLRRPFYVGEHTVSVTSSLGISIAAARNADGQDDTARTEGSDRAHSVLEFGQLLNQADIAMSWAKHSQDELPTEAVQPARTEPDYAIHAAAQLRLQAQHSQSRYRFFEPQMQAKMRARSKLHKALKQAIINQELRVHYQPIVELATHQTVGFEALVRWQHPERGLLLPGDFLPAAEEMGLMVSIDRWVIETVCRQLASWRQTSLQRQPILNVNLCSAHLSEPGLVSHMSKLLTRFAIPAQQLNLEITESVMIAHPQQAIRTLRSLKALGLRISLDDFGTGYSSLGYLHRLPVDVLKIDRSFLQTLGEAHTNSDQHSALSGSNRQPENRRMGKCPEDAVEATSLSMGSSGTYPSLRSNEVIVKTILLMADSLNLQVVAEGIERPDQLQRLNQMDCQYGQGILFSHAVSARSAEALMA